jgi:ankyrin repeat protein
VAVATGAEPLFQAIEAGDLDQVQELVGANPALASARNERDLSPVLAATYRHRHDLVEVLLAARPELDVFDAAAVGDTARLVALLDADPSLASAFAPDGFTPLSLAAYFGRTEAVRVLTERGADVGATARNAMAVQPLHAAVAGRNFEAVSALVVAGADVNARQHGGWTPLMQAAAHGDLEIVDVLLAAGADPSMSSDEGKTPASLAEENGHAALAEQLRALSLPT